MSLSGWHPGESAIHSLLNISAAARMLYMHISGDMPEQHRDFYSDPVAVAFLPVTVLDETGRPWASILSRGPKPANETRNSNNFVSSPTDTTLVIRPQLWPGDPLTTNLKHLQDSLNGKSNLVAGLGIQFSTRRRNKFAGKITRISLDEENKEGMDVRLDVEVNQAVGNCPKYINARSFTHHPETHPKVVYNVPDNTGQLPPALISFILNSDTVFVGSSYVAKPLDAMRFPSHVGMNARGGKKGFVRVRKDGKTIVLPDYSGNRFYSTIGSIQSIPLAALTFVSFTTGSILYLTGDAINHVGAAASAIMPLLPSELVTTVEVTGFVFVEDALPWRSKTQDPSSEEEERTVSPYSPPIRLLAEESNSASSSLTVEGEKTEALLSAIELHSPDLATFTWKVELPADTRLDTIRSGQAAIMDMSALVGKNQYAHMNPYRPQDVNDDRIRTWTMSSFQRPMHGGSLDDSLTPDFQMSASNSNSISFMFTTTLRKKAGGLVTSALFSIAGKISTVKPKLLADSTPLGLTVGFHGIVGEFTLPAEDDTNKLLWVAGGVGITPFLAMLDSLVASEQEAAVDIVMALATREPQVLLPLIDKRLNAKNVKVKKLSLVVHVYDSSSTSLSPSADYVFAQSVPQLTASVVPHSGRLSETFFLENGNDIVHGRRVYVCGPDALERVVLDAVADVVGAGKHAIVGQVVREGFSY